MRKGVASCSPLPLALCRPAAARPRKRRAQRPRRPMAKACPKAWQASWQKLANRIHAPVYCPSWLPDPLTGLIGGKWNNINSVSKDRSYLMGFVWQEIGQEIHINLRGYPGVTKVPTCRSVELVGGKKHRRRCRASEKLSRHEGRSRAFRVTKYTRSTRTPTSGSPLRLAPRRLALHASASTSRRRSPSRWSSGSERSLGALVLVNPSGPVRLTRKAPGDRAASQAAR